MTDFLKAADTKTQVAKSQADIETLLRRYGAKGYGMQLDYERLTVTISFRLPLAGGGEMPVSIPLSWARVADLLRKRRKGYLSPRDKEALNKQAERVAWRHLYLFIDAALTAVQVGIQTPEEAFFAHALVRTSDGDEGRIVDYIRTLGAPTDGILPSPLRLTGGR